MYSQHPTEPGAKTQEMLIEYVDEYLAFFYLMSTDRNVDLKVCIFPFLVKKRLVFFFSIKITEKYIRKRLSPY